MNIFTHITHNEISSKPHCTLPSFICQANVKGSHCGYARCIPFGKPRENPKRKYVLPAFMRRTSDETYTRHPVMALEHYTSQKIVIQNTKSD